MWGPFAGGIALRNLRSDSVQNRRGAFVSYHREVRNHDVNCSHFVLNCALQTAWYTDVLMDQNTNDILEAVNFIKEKVEHLPTKDDVRRDRRRGYLSLHEKSWEGHVRLRG
jgi:hypothetical protein